MANSVTDTTRGRTTSSPRRRILAVACVLALAAIGVACASTAQRPGVAGDAATGRHTPTRTLTAAPHSSTAVPNPHPTAPVSGTPCPVVTVKPIAGCPICPDVHEAPPNGPLPCPPCGSGPAQGDPPCPICPPNATGDPPTPCSTPPPPPAPPSPPSQQHPTISICSPTQTQGLICGSGFQADEKVSLTGTTRSGSITWQVAADGSGNVKTALPPVLCKLLPVTLIANGSGGDRSNALTLGPDVCLPTA